MKKSRIYKVVLALCAIAFILDWPTTVSAVSGKQITKGAETVSGLFRSCTKAAKETEEVNGSGVRNAVKGARMLQEYEKSNSQYDNYQSTPRMKCSNCAGRGVELWDDGSQYTCSVCMGHGYIQY